jgi:ketosteroid isomerase-like protein
MRRDSENLALCDKFFDAIERDDYDTLEALYAPEAVVWHSGDMLYEPRASNLAMLKKSMGTGNVKRYKNRRIHTFEGGFVQQHTMYVTYPDGFVGQMDVCFIAYTRAGMISRIYEYYDGGKIDKFLPPEVLAARKAAASSAASS